MSITFTTEIDTRRTTNYSCQCADQPEGPWADCFECKGTGRVEIGYDEHSFNLCNSNGWELQRMLGLEPGYAGQIEHQHVTDIINSGGCQELASICNWRPDVLRNLIQLWVHAQKTDQPIIFG